MEVFIIPHCQNWRLDQEWNLVYSCWKIQNTFLSITVIGSEGFSLLWFLSQQECHSLSLFLEIWPERTGLKLNMFLPSRSHVNPTFERRNKGKLKSCPVFAVQEYRDSFMVVFQGNKMTRKRQRYIFKSNKIPLIANRFWIIRPPSTLGKKNDFLNYLTQCHF